MTGASAGVMVNIPDGLDANDPVADAFRVYCPAVLMLSPLKLATPATAVTVVVPLRVPDPDAIDTVTDAVDDVTVFPPASVITTTG